MVSVRLGVLSTQLLRYANVWYSRPNVQWPVEYVSSDERELSMVFDCDLANLGSAREAPSHEVTN